MRYYRYQHVHLWPDDARGLGEVNVGAGQSFEVHGGGLPLLEVEVDWVVASSSSLVLADLQLVGGSGGAASVSVASGGELSLLRVEVESAGAVSFSGSVSVMECVLMGVDLAGRTATGVLSVSGGTLTGSSVSLSDGSATLGGSCALVNSPVSMTAGTLSVSQCELQSDGTSVPLTIESGGSATVTGVAFRSGSWSAGDITAVSVVEGGSLTVGESQLVGADGSSDPFPCDGTLPDCAAEHAGSVVVDGPAVITLASPLVCDVGTGECLNDLCYIVDCGVGGTCISPHGTCECDQGYFGDHCEHLRCCRSTEPDNCGRWHCPCNYGCGSCSCSASDCSGRSLSWCDAHYAGWDASCDRSC